MPSIFSKIINGEIPSYKILEDELTLAILTIEPIQLGHTLVIAKQEIDHFIDVDDATLQQVILNAKKIGRALYQVTGCQRIGTAVVGFEVAHFHHHVIPMEHPSDLDFLKARPRTKDEMHQMQEKILNALSS